ncbi:MAG: penicillin-binding protein activator LpoB [Bacteroidales bacterium]|nr:penicillin-binding protein activator LpoB [Bacteroidales bacterium]
MNILYEKIITYYAGSDVVVSIICQGEKTLKRKVAIGRFTNETQYGQGLFYDRGSDPMGKQALDILSAKLAASEKFILLERDGLEELVAEAGGNMQKIGADYIILGSITKFGRKTEGDKGVFTESKTQTVEAGVSIRLVDVYTGMIIYSDEANGYAETTSKQSFGYGGSANYDATLSDEAISAALTQLVENIINKCMDKPWRGYVLAIEDGTYVISGGKSQGIEEGSTFVLYKKGRKVNNPQTGMQVELPGTKLGTLTVLSSVGDTPETEISFLSFCSYEGEAIQENELLNYYLLEQ